MQRVLWVPAVVLLGVMSVPAAAQSDSTIPGRYLVQGTNPEGTSYTGVLEMVQRGEVVYARWTFEDGKQTHGIGLVRLGMLAISYPNGVVVYPVTADGIETGEWVLLGADEVYTERLTKVPEGIVLPTGRVRQL